MTKKIKNLIIGFSSGLTVFFTAVGVVGLFLWLVRKVSPLLKIMK